MKYAIEKSEKYTKIVLQEEKLDTLIAPKLKSEFVTLHQAGTSNLILDLSEVKYVDSSGLSSILVANRLVKEANGFLAIIGVNEHVLKLVKISKLDTVLNLLANHEDAVNAIFMNEIEKDLKEEDGGNESA